MILHSTSSIRTVANRHKDIQKNSFFLGLILSPNVVQPHLLCCIHYRQQQSTALINHNPWTNSATITFHSQYCCISVCHVNHDRTFLWSIIRKSYDISHSVGSMQILLEDTKTMQESPYPSFRVLVMQYIQRCGKGRGLDSRLVTRCVRKLDPMKIFHYTVIPMTWC